MALPAGEGFSRLDADDRVPSEHPCRSVGPVVRVSPWKGLQRGDVVFVADMYWPNMVGIRFQFECYAENIESGIGWVEVFGGPKGRQWVRAFPVHAIRVPAKRVRE